MSSTLLWRESFEVFERLLALTPEIRRTELTQLEQSRPDLYAQVLKLFQADAQTRSGDFLDVSTVAAGMRGDMPVEQHPGATVGPYKLERTLGAGGMGEVWFARRADGLFEAPVALKLLHAHLAASSVRSRFVREGKMLGQLTHPNIAHLLDAGITSAGQLYLAIEYVEGVSLDRWCDEQKLDVAARVRLFLQVCDAVAHAHAHLIVHRDLKPSNILVTPEGNIKLLDFGIAKLTESTEGESEQTELTRMGGRVLTPEYAAPEQIISQPVSVTTDVYSLGVLLYVLLSGRRPYGQPGQSLSQLEREVLETEPEPVSHTQSGLTQEESEALAAQRSCTRRKLRDTLKGDLDVIVGKALKKKPDDRYPSVPALADDLRRYLNNEPVLARPDSITYRARKYVRRHRLGVTIVSMLALGLIVSTKLYLDARTARIQAEKETAQAKALSDFLQWDVLAGINSESQDSRLFAATKALLDSGSAKIGERLANQPVVAAKLRGSFIQAYHAIGANGENRKLVAENQALAKRLVDEHSPDAAEVATVPVFLEEEDASYQEQLDALATAQWPADDMRALTIKTGTAGMRQARGDYAGARQRLDQVLEGLKQVDPHSDIFNAARFFIQLADADLYMALGEYDRADPILATMLDQSLRGEGFSGAAAAYARKEAALSWMNTGRLAEADQVMSAALKDVTSTHGQSNRLVIDIKVGFGMLRTLEGRYAEAQEIADPALALYDAQVTNDGGDGAWKQMMMARQCEIQGRFDLAASRLRQLLTTMDRYAPPDSLQIARARLALANVLREQGQLPQAREQIRLIPASTVAKLEFAPPDRVELRRADGLLALAEGRRDEAVTKLGEALQLSQQIYSDKSFWTIRLRKELDGAQVRQPG